MALPDPENLAYEGQTSGKAKCMVWGGFFCDVIVKSFINMVRVVVQVTRSIRKIT